MGLLLFTLLFLKLLLCLQLVLQVHSNSSIDTDTITNECTEIVHVASWWELISASFQIVEKYSLLSYLGLLEITPERLKDISELQSLPIEAQIYRKKTNSYSIKHTYSGTSAENRCQSIDSLVSEYGRHPLNKILFYLRTYYVDSSTGLQKYWRCHSDDREGSSNTDYHSTNNTSSNNSNSNSIRNNASLIRSDCYSMITSYEVESQTLKTVKSRTQALLQSPQQEIAGAGADYDENLKFVSALDLSLIFSMAALDAAKTYERSYSRRYAAASEGVSGTLDSEKNDKAYKLIHKDLNKRAVQLAKDRQHFSNSVDSALLLVDIYINDSVIPFINYRLGIAMYEQKLSIHWNKNLPSSSSSDDNDTNLKNTSSSGRLIRILDSVETIFPTDGVPSEAKIVVVEYVISELDVMVPLISNSGQIDGDYIVKRYLYSGSMDASDDYYLLNINGYGAFSSEYFECYLQNDAKTLETLQSDCFPVSRAGFYADIINGPAMFLTYSITFGDQLDNRFVDLFIAADTKQKKINYLRQVAYLPTSDDEPAYLINNRRHPRFLALGLGSGGLHKMLLSHYPTMIMESVELSAVVTDMSLKYFSLDQYVCGIYELLTNGTTTNEDVETFPDNNFVDDNVCRSIVVIADAWEYINFRASMNNLIKQGSIVKNTSYYDHAQLRPILTNYVPARDPRLQKVQKFDIGVIHYDYILFDVYDISAFMWDGVAFAGRSVARVETASATETLMNVKDLLTPNVGVAIFHLHKDSQFSSYVHQIETIFGKSQVIRFTISSNDNIIVAGNGVFEMSYESIEEFVKLQSEKSVSKERNDEETMDVTGSINFQVDSLESSNGPGVLTHPCRDIVKYSDYITEMMGKKRYTLLNQYVPRYALNCTGVYIPETENS